MPSTEGASYGDVNIERLILETFKKFDANKDGTISEEELGAVLAAVSKESVTDAQVKELLTTIDANKDGRVQYEEFISWVMRGNTGESTDSDFKGIERRGTNHIHVDVRSLLPERFEMNPSERYALDKLALGEGGYGKVFVARDKHFENRTVAVKKVTQTGSAKSLDSLREEIKYMKEMDHPNICKLLGTFEKGRDMYFIMELCEGGEVFDRIIAKGHISEGDTAEIVSQVAAALAYAHGRKVAHRDIKPENVVFCNKSEKDLTVKVIDWGLAMSFVGTPMRSAVGSFTYAAPEVMTCKNLHAYTEACDCWSLGVLTYVMLCGRPPFWGTDTQHLRNAMAEKYPMAGEVWDAVSSGAKDFVKKLIKATPTARMTMDQTVQHPWLVGERPVTDDSVSKQVFSNLSKYAKTSSFSRICIAAVARQLDHRDLKDIHQVFRKLDKNGDGVLSLEEITSGLSELLGEDNPDVKNAIEIFHNLDLDGSDAIDYTEFCAAGLAEKTASQEDVIWAGFKTFDHQDKGKISVEDLQKILNTSDFQDVWSKQVCAEVGKEIVQQFDKDHDGMISFEEFKILMRSCWSKQRNTAEGSTAAFQGMTAYELLVKVSDLKVAGE